MRKRNTRKKTRNNYRHYLHGECKKAGQTAFPQKDEAIKYYQISINKDPDGPAVAGIIQTGCWSK